MKIQTIINTLKFEEGFSSHVYKDHRGFDTIGYGRLVDESKGGGITEVEAELLLINDIGNVTKEITHRFPKFEQLSENRQTALILMGFQLGVPGLFRFKKMIAALDIGHYDRAYTEAIDSKWAKQTPNRALRVADLIRKG